MTRRQSDGYGSLEWFERQYGRVDDDPWGLTWRPSQSVRYHRALSLVQRIEMPITRVLDIGCATGDFTYLLGRHLTGLESLIGVDFVESAIVRARTRFPDQTFLQQSIFDVGERYCNQFDLAVCLEVLYYVPPDRRGEAIRSLKATLRPNGYALFSSLISQSPHFAPEELLRIVNSEFDIVTYDILHLRIVSLLERIGTKLEAILKSMQPSITQGPGSLKLGRLPLRGVVSIDKGSRVLRGLTQSHTLVLARMRA